MTTAFNFAKVDTSVPTLPQPSLSDSRVTTSSCAVGAPLDLVSPSNTTFDKLESTVVPPYPITVNTRPPAQESGNARPPSGPVCGPGAKGKLSARGVRVRTHNAFKGTIATFSDTNSALPAATFTAWIHWGDGHVSRGKIVGSDGRFRVVAHHRFAKAKLYRARVTITAASGASAVAHSRVMVVRRRTRPVAKGRLPHFTG